MGIQRLLRDGIMSMVLLSLWAAAIVPVLKEDDAVRISGDFKMTVNDVATTEKYTSPRAQRIEAKTTVGTMFWMLHLRDAYCQVELEPEVRDFVTSNTPWGLYQCKSLSFTVSSAPEISPKQLENVLRHSQGVVIYFDDVLVIGGTEEKQREYQETLLHDCKSPDGG